MMSSFAALGKVNRTLVDDSGARVLKMLER